MTRTMGDAIHDNVSALAGVSGLELVAGYVTGSPDIVWTAADWARFPGIPHVEIDQGFTGAPVYSATVQDVETGAWTPGSVPSWQSHCTAPRPTVYCNQSTLPAVLATGWRGNLWLAIPGWQNGAALPSAPGCTVVAVQNQLDVASAYDLSTVLDPTWPEAAVTTPVNQLPTYFSATPYTVIRMGWGAAAGAPAEVQYSWRVADMAGTVVAQGRTAATSAQTGSLPAGSYQWSLATGATANPPTLASPWSPWMPIG